MSTAIPARAVVFAQSVKTSAHFREKTIVHRAKETNAAPYGNGGAGSPFKLTSKP